MNAQRPQPSVIAGRFEARKIAWRQTKDGIVLSLAVHPNDAPPDLAMADIGTILEIAYREPIEEPETPVSELVKPAKERRPWDTMKRSQQSGILCGDEQFSEWLSSTYSETWDRAMQTCEQRAALATAEAVRNICGVTTRAQLDNRGPSERWDALVTDFRIATGQLVDPR